MTDYHNPLSVVIPSDFHHHNDLPTEVVASRFQAYRDIIKDLISYLRQYASVQEEIVRQQVRLQQAVGAPSQSVTAVVSPTEKSSAHSHSHARNKDKSAIDDDLSAINQFFLPIGNGSIQDIPTILTKFHQQNIQLGTKTLKEINLVIIPKLEDLRKDLLIKVKEIKNLQNDFKNTLAKEMAETKTLINSFNHSIDVANHLEKLGSNASLHHESTSDVDVSKKDPYLVKIKLERQLKKQLYEESYLYEAYKNLQVSSEKLESIVVLEIQNNMGLFLSLVENEHSSVPNFLVPNLTNGFLSKEPSLEWDAFVERNLPRSSTISNTLTSGTFIDLSFPTRKLSDLTIPHYDSLLNVPVREGLLERRLKFLKSYSGGWYVLTCSYLHEFKSPDRKKDQIPVMSLSLDHCLVSEHSKNDGKASGNYKFVLYSKLQNGLIHRGHNWSFRCDTYASMIEWYNDIKTLTSLASPSARAKAMSKKLMANNAAKHKVSRSSSIASAQTGAKSIKSDTASRLQNKLSPRASVRSGKSYATSQRSVTTSSGQNQRLSSTFSQKYHQSPKLTNLINSDGTTITPADHAHDTRSVDKNGNIYIRSLIEQPVPEPEATQGNLNYTPITIPTQNTQSTPQQTIPQNYQYYLNLVNQAPQQFYDPVLQQFFTINAVPALQVAQLDQGMVQVAQAAPGQQSNPQLVQLNGQPMPQYFPSSPLPAQGQALGAGSPNAKYFPSSPQLQEYNKGENGQQQHIPHYPNQFNEPSGNLPMPGQLGDSFAGSRQESSGENGPAFTGERNHSIDEQISRLAVDDRA